VGLTWAYCLAWIFIEDQAKLHIYHHLYLSGKRHQTFLQRIQEGIHPHSHR
jgi:H+-transporting ATPase